MNRSGSAGEPVLITGVGIVSPLGATREATWRAVLTGERAGICLDPTVLGAAWHGVPGSRTWYGCPARRTADESFAAESFGREPFVGDALSAATEALAHAGLTAGGDERWGCVVGASKGGMHRAVPIWMRTGDWSLAAPGPDGWLSCWPNAPSSAIAQRWNIQGPVLAPGAACATGLVSLIRAADLIRSGVCDVVLAGSSDASLQPALLASYQRLGVMSRSTDPQSACKPFDRDRDGFLVGEGAAVLVLESASHVAARGATPLAEFVAGRSLSGGAGMTSLDESAEGLSRAIGDLLVACRTSLDKVDLINWHGTGTQQNDRTEITALLSGLDGDSWEGRSCAFKGALGHLMGAAGSVEAALCVLALRDQVVPPTANLTTFDPQLLPPGHTSAEQIAASFSPVARSGVIQTVLKTSLGFGGPVATGLFQLP